MSHLLYMDDLKIYAGGPDKLREAMECVEKTLNVIGMSEKVWNSSHAKGESSGWPRQP